MKTLLMISALSLLSLGCGQETNCDNNGAVAVRAMTRNAATASPTPTPTAPRSATPAIAVGDGCSTAKADCTVDQFAENCT